MNAKFLLVVSVLLNGVLTVCLARSRTLETPPPIAMVKDRRPTIPHEDVHERIRTVTHQVVEKLDWRSVESEDYRRYITNLREIGCPEETIGDIIRADVNKLFQSRRKALTGPTGAFKFWKPGNPFAVNPDLVQKQQELTQEQRAILKDLLGKEPGNEAVPESNPFADVLAFLSPQQQQQVLEIRGRFKSALQQNMSGSTSPDERRQKVREADQQMELELSRTMTSEEKEEYDLRLSQTAAKMREHLAAFEPTEQEFRNLFRFRKAFEDTIANLSSRTGDEQQRQAAEEDFYANARQVLGGSRYADFLRALRK